MGVERGYSLLNLLKCVPIHEMSVSSPFSSVSLPRFQYAIWSLSWILRSIALQIHTHGGEGVEEGDGTVDIFQSFGLSNMDVHISD